MSTHSNIVRTLGTEIMAGVHRPGENLPLEADLLKRFGVSRTALREAIKTLSAKGLLVAKTRVGTRVADSASWNYFDPDVLAWRVEAGTDAAFRESLKGGNATGRRMSMTKESVRCSTGCPFANPGRLSSSVRMRQYATPPSERTRKMTASRSSGEHVVY